MEGGSDDGFGAGKGIKCYLCLGKTLIVVISLAFKGSQPRTVVLDLLNLCLFHHSRYGFFFTSLDVDTIFC